MITNPISAFDSLPDESKRKNQRVLEALYRRRFTQMPTDLGSGIASIGDALAYRAAQNKAQGPFPTAPGGQQPSLGTQIGNFFGFGARGGLY